MSLPSITGSVNTTNATTATLLTVPVPSNTIRGIDGYVIARRTGGSAGAAEDGAYYIVSAVYNNISGTATIIGEDIISVGESQAGWAVSVAVSGNNFLIQVTGAVNNNISWTGYIEVLSQI